MRRAGSPARPRALTLAAPAKLNLSLEVLGRRSDGFHDLSTVMVCVDLLDTVRLRVGTGRARGIRFLLKGRRRGIPAGGENLCVRAARRYLARAGLSGTPLTIELTKRIPHGAGLGGGSSDAAAVLLGLEAILGPRLGPRVLSEVAAEIGSDVPFFLRGPAALCEGRGERVAPFRIPRPLHFVVVHPAVTLQTPRVFRELLPGEKGLRSTRSRARLIRVLLERGRMDGMPKLLVNALEAPAQRLSPRLKHLQFTLERLPFLSVSMTGSGSAYFGLTRSARQARRLARRLLQIHPSIGRVFAVRSLGSRARGKGLIRFGHLAGRPAQEEVEGEHHSRPD